LKTRFVIPEGRLKNPSIRLLKKLGVDVPLPSGRELVVETEDYIFFFAKPFDVPVYVEHGIDLGIAGSDVVEERNCDLFIPLELPFGRCRLSVIMPEDHVIKVEEMDGFRIATKYPNIASRYFAGRGLDVEIMKLHGTVELAPKTRIAEALVDIVDTGRTLRANGLVEVEKIMDVSAMLLVNRIAQKTRFTMINELVMRMKQLLKEGTS